MFNRHVQSIILCFHYMFCINNCSCSERQSLSNISIFVEPTEVVLRFSPRSLNWKSDGYHFYRITSEGQMIQYYDMSTNINYFYVELKFQMVMWPQLTFRQRIYSKPRCVWPWISHLFDQWTVNCYVVTICKIIVNVIDSTDWKLSLNDCVKITK